MGSDISAKEADLILEKLYSESVPVLAYYVRDGVKVMRHGVLTAVGEHGVVVADKGASEPVMDYLAIKIGFSSDGTVCTFWYGDHRDMPADKRTELTEILGDTVLAFYCPDGGQLNLYFSL